MLEFIKKNWVIVVGGVVFLLTLNRVNGNDINSAGMRTNPSSVNILDFLGICKYCLWGVVIGVYFKDNIAKFFVNIGRNFMINDIMSSEGSFLASNKSIQDKEHKVRSALAGV